MKELSFILVIVLLIFAPAGIISYLRPQDETLLLTCLAINCFMFIIGYYLSGFFRKNLDLDFEDGTKKEFETKNIIEGKFEDED